MSNGPSYQYPWKTTHFESLCSLTYGDDIEENLEHLECPNCDEKYSKDPWEFGKTCDYPVRLHCGHFYGLKCLAQMIVSNDFSHQCPQCSDHDPLLPRSLNITGLIESEGHSEYTGIDMAIHNAISVAAFSCAYDEFEVDWTKLFMHVYEFSYVFYFHDFTPEGGPPDHVFSRPLLLLEVALRSMGFFNGDCNLPDVPQLQQDLNDLRKIVDSHLTLYRLGGKDWPNECYPLEAKDMMSRADYRGTIFANAVMELRAKYEKTRRMKDLQDEKTRRMKDIQEYLWQDITWFFWQKIKDFLIMLLALLAGI